MVLGVVQCDAKRATLGPCQAIVYPPPPCPSHGKRPEIDGTNAQCCLDNGVGHTLHCAWSMWKDMQYSQNQGAEYAPKAIMPKSASLTQNMNIMHLKTHVLDSTHSTQ